MSGIPIIEKDVVFYDAFDVIDADGNIVTGLVDGNFTKALYDPSGSEVSGVTTVTIAELGNGLYRFNFTPGTTGAWTIKIFHATHFPAGLSANYRCAESSLIGSDSTKIDELYKIRGLDSSNPATHTPDSQEAGSINIVLTGDGITRKVLTRT
jgi:hypothetical protein